MEGMQRIKEKIIEDANKQADTLIKEAEKEAERILAQGKKEAERKKKALQEKAVKESEEAKKKIMSMAELEMRKQMLAVKQRMVDEAFERALKKLQSLEGKEYEEIITKMLEKAVETGDEEIIFSPADAKKLKPEFLENLNKNLAVRGVKPKLSISKETRDIQGGFILKSKGVEINSSFDSIIRMERDEIESQIAAILFED
ncbi:MAG: V/A-type H+/Na+-transporting ATPase subunit [Thermosediminibacterales bacterium]|nr:V/A-type H+/Na+-transporting ATPase subunit [Thermosediminibacterales bacterium]MDK2836011.1 V/A-type H+/Na+-transporting ATPase subunit [Thermosediminibacterales bacterium]